MMKSRWGYHAVAAILVSIFACVLCFSAAAHAAVPGLDLFNNGHGVCTWTTNNNGTQFTGILHGVWVVDHDNGISSDGNSHIVTVSYPGGFRTRRLWPTSSCGPAGCYYEHYDGDVDQGNLSPFNGIYTYRVEEADDSTIFSEATDDLTVAPVDMLDESTFAPKHPTPQAITAYFDNVYVNGSLYDDFSTGFNPDKWSYQPNWVTYESGQAKFDLDFNPGRGSYWLNLKDPASVNQLKAVVRVTRMTGDLPQARVGGAAVRDHLGDVFALVRIKGNQATYMIGTEWTEGNHSKSFYYVKDAVLGPVTTDNRYELSLAWDAGSKTYTFGVKGLDDSVDYAAGYTLIGPISPANSPYGGIGVAGWVTTSTTPEFDWAPVAGAKHYRIRIYCPNNVTIWRGYAKNPPYKLPPGILKPHSYYKYRIEAIGDHQWFEWDNVSRSDRELTRFETHGEEAQAPCVDLASVGAQSWREDALGDAMSFYVKVHDAQGVPRNIESVTVQVPGGDEVNLYLNTNEGPTCGIYSGSYYGGVPSGDYVFTALDKDLNVHSVTDHVIVSPIDAPSEPSLWPLDNAVIDDTAVSFQWEGVDGANQYAVQLLEQDMNEVLITVRSTEDQAFLPPGILDEGGYYRYRVVARREFFEENSDNSSSAPAGSFYDAHAFFTTANTGGTSVPTIDISSFGVAIWKAPHPNGDGTIYNLNFSAMVSDGDGVPANIRSVEVELPDGTRKPLKFDDRPDWGFNYFEDETYTSTAPIQTGDYRFWVTDFDRNTIGPVTDTLTAADLAAAIGFQWAVITSPVDNTTLDTASPTITWIPPTDAIYCRVSVHNAYGADEVYLSDPIPVSTTQLTIDPGILQTNRSYGIRVYSFRESSGVEVDVYSDTAAISQMYVHVHVPDTVTGTDIVVAPLDQNTGAALATLTFDQVTASGTTTLSSSSTGMPPPSGFSLGMPPTYYDIATTASFTGDIEVCINYSSVFFENENELRFYHYEDPEWVDRTTSLDTENDIICGQLGSLGLFALFEPKYCPGDLEPDGDVDGADVQAFSVSFVTGTPDGDLNGDGLVDTSDLLILLKAFGRTDCAASP